MTAFSLVLLFILVVLTYSEFLNTSRFLCSPLRIVAKRPYIGGDLRGTQRLYFLSFFFFFSGQAAHGSWDLFHPILTWDGTWAMAVKAPRADARASREVPREALFSKGRVY